MNKFQRDHPKWDRSSLVSLLIALLITGCGGPDGQRKPEYEFRMASVLAEKDVSGYGANKFAELVKEKSNGRIEIRVFHGGQLGSGVETFEAVKNGHLDMAADSFANLAGITTAFEAFHLPFLFDSRGQMLSVFRSEKIRQEINDELSGAGLRWFSTFEIGGPREVATTRQQIQSVDDFKGLKFRASRSPLEIAAQEAWGAKGVTVDWPETPEALRLGMVDGLTVPYASLHSARFHEGDLIRYILDLNFQCYAVAIVVNSEAWRGLPENVRQILTDSAREAEAWHVEFLGDYITKNVREIEEKGVLIYSLPEAEHQKLKRLTKEQVWGAFVGRPGISQDKVDLIIGEMGLVETLGWGYPIP